MKAVLGMIAALALAALFVTMGAQILAGLLALAIPIVSVLAIALMIMHFCKFGK